MPEKGVDTAINIFLVVFLGSILLPIGFDNWFASNITDGWGSGVSQIWPVIPVMALIGVLYMLYKKYV